MKVKFDVIINGVQPETVLGVLIVQSTLSELGYDTVLTSVLDGKHSRASLHHVGFAFDVRSRDIPEEKRETVRQEFRKALPRDFDVVLEKTHFHIEFQPKRP